MNTEAKQELRKLVDSLGSDLLTAGRVGSDEVMEVVDSMASPEKTPVYCSLEPMERVRVLNAVGAEFH